MIKSGFSVTVALFWEIGILVHTFQSCNIHALPLLYKMMITHIGMVDNMFSLYIQSDVTPEKGLYYSRIHLVDHIINCFFT